MLSTGADWAWLGVIAGAFLLFWSPVIVAAVRDIERMGLVVMLVLLALGTGGVTWFASWIVVFRMPRRARQSATWQAPGDPVLQAVITKADTPDPGRWDPRA